MANILFGSSNVYRNFERAVNSGCFSGRDFELVKCTQKAAFDSHLATLNTSGLIVSSVLENFITDVCKGVPDDEIQLFAHQQVTAHVDGLAGLISRLPGVSVVICPPMYRSSPAWYGSYLPDLLGFLAAEVSRVGSSQLGLCSPFIVVPSILESDGVHLTPAGGDRFLAHIDAELQAMLVNSLEETSPMDNIPATSDLSTGSDQLSQILNAVNRNSTQLDSISAVGETVTRLARTTAEFEAFARRRFRNDDVIFARLKEEADADLNKAREDRVVLTGLPSAPATATLHSDKKKHFVDVISRLVTIACVSADPLPKVTDVYINLRKERGQPLVEARFDTVSGAQLFCREGVKLAKAENPEFVTLFFANSVTQSTRVRIEVLKALAKKLTTPSESAFVQGFISRPVLQYRVKDGARSTADGVGRSYNYVDAIGKFGSRLASRDLSLAYTRAGSTFTGAMSQYFIILSDALVSGGGISKVNRAPLGRRGGHSSIPRRGALSFRPSIHQETDLLRGTKRAGDPAAGPSKKTENELVDEVME